MHGVGVEQPGFRIERGVRPVLGAALRRPEFDLLAGAHLLGHVGLDGPSRLHVDARGPVHPLVGVGRQQLAVGAVEHVEKAVAVELHHDLAHLARRPHVGQDRFPGGVVVEHVVRRELVVPGDLARSSDCSASSDAV